MRIIIDSETRRLGDSETHQTYIDTDITDLDDNEVNIYRTGGFGATDVSIAGSGGLTWDEWDKLKEAMNFAENKWRSKPK